MNNSHKQVISEDNNTIFYIIAGYEGAVSCGQCKKSNFLLDVFYALIYLI